MNDFLTSCKHKMAQSLAALQQELLRTRTGRASVNLLDAVNVRYYGSNVPISQVATVSAPDARSIVISPYEKSVLPDIEKAIMAANIGLQPTSDGNIIRVTVPPLTEDRRKELVKKIKKIGEECKVAVRLIRQDTNNSIKKDKELAEDDAKRIQRDIQKETDANIVAIDAQIAKKEKEILTI
ncbi:MAG: ribosome recycling factor [Pseudomonadota bacterium]|nr:ribosome recycling factor [Pseudomonadota bacterium]